MSSKYKKYFIFDLTLKDLLVCQTKKNMLQRFRQDKLTRFCASATLLPRRFLTTSTTSSTDTTDTTPSTTPTNHKRIFGAPKNKKWKKGTKRAQNIINILEKEQVEKCLVGRKHWPDFEPGDAIQVSYKPNKSRTRLQKMRGIVLGRRNRGMGSTFLVHNIIAGTPYEINFPLHSPLIENIEMIQRSFIHNGKKRMKRAKLNYLRDYLPSKITVKDTLLVEKVEGLNEIKTV